MKSNWNINAVGPIMRKNEKGATYDPALNLNIVSWLFRLYQTAACSTHKQICVFQGDLHNSSIMWLPMKLFETAIIDINGLLDRLSRYRLLMILNIIFILYNKCPSFRNCDTCITNFFRTFHITTAFNILEENYKLFYVEKIRCTSLLHPTSANHVIIFLKKPFKYILMRFGDIDWICQSVASISHFSSFLHMPIKPCLFLSKASHIQQPTYDVFLGGTCNTIRWRETVVIPILKKFNITYYNPVVPEWSQSLIKREHIAKRNSKILFFYFAPNNLSMSALIETSYLASRNRNRLVVVLPKSKEQIISFYYMYLAHLLQKLNVNVFETLSEGVVETLKKLRKYKTIHFDNVKNGGNMNLLLMKESYTCKWSISRPGCKIFRRSYTCKRRIKSSVKERIYVPKFSKITELTFSYTCNFTKRSPLKMLKARLSQNGGHTTLFHFVSFIQSLKVCSYSTLLLNSSDHFLCKTKHGSNQAPKIRIFINEFVKAELPSNFSFRPRSIFQELSHPICDFSCYIIPSDHAALASSIAAACLIPLKPIFLCIEDVNSNLDKRTDLIRCRKYLADYAMQNFKTARLTSRHEIIKIINNNLN